MRCRFVMALLTLGFGAQLSFAQTEKASVSGRVTDQNNAVVPDVEVQIRNTDTNVVGLAGFSIFHRNAYAFSKACPMALPQLVRGSSCSRLVPRHLTSMSPLQPIFLAQRVHG
jgi:hypothetical protein